MIVTVSLTHEASETDSHLNYSVAFGDIDGDTVTVEQFKAALADAINKVGNDARHKGWIV